LDIESRFPRPIAFQLAPDINRSASPSTNSGFPWRRVLRLCRRSPTDSHRPSILRLCQGVDCQLPPELHPTLHLQISFRLAPNTASSSFTFGPTSNSSSDIESSGCTFRPTASLRRPSTFQSCFRTRSPACTGHRTLQLHLLDPAPTFIGTRILRLCLPTQPPTLHRVSRPPTSPSSQPPTFVGHRPSGSALRLTSGFHRRRIFGFSLRTRLPTFIGTRILWFCQRLTFVLDWSLNPPAVPSISCRLASTLNHSAVPATNFPVSFEDFILRLCLPAGSRLASVTTPSTVSATNSRLPTGHQLRRTLGLAHLCMQVQIVGFLWISTVRPSPAASARARFCKNASKSDVFVAVAAVHFLLTKMKSAPKTQQLLDS